MSNHIQKSETQAQTENTFGFKWHKRETYESENVQKDQRFSKYENTSWEDLKLCSTICGLK